MKWLSALRPINLIIVALTQLIVYIQCILPYFSSIEDIRILTPCRLILFVLITCIIAGAANVVNDYFDLETDKINNKNQNDISSAHLWKCYWLLVTLGMILSIYLAFDSGNIGLIWIYPFVTVLLYLYSSRFKRRGLIGNLLVSFFCALVAFMLVIAEWPNIDLLNTPLIGAMSGMSIISFYMVFAFFSTLYREIIKDIEDIHGDRAFGYSTLPLSIGLNKSIYFSVIQGFVLLFLLLFWSYFSFLSIPSIALIYLNIFATIPLILAIKRTFSAKVTKDFRAISLLLKWIMLNGILFLLFL